MIYRKQTDFDKFKCIADKCPKSCCVGWQIMIDEDSIEKYKNTKGAFSDRLQSGINYDESSFNQTDMRCSMLNKTGLCDLQSTLGESYLCNTCRQYPRHTEEFQDIREYSLSLSCPEVTRMLMDPTYKFEITESNDDALDDPAEFEDFDFLLFDKLEYARDKMLTLASDSSIELQDRLTIIAAAAMQLQELYDEGEIFEMDSVAYDLESSQDFIKHHPGTGIPLDYDYCINSLDVLIGMESLEQSWTDSIIATKKYWSTADTMHLSNEETYIFEKILESLIFTYFCGAIYDGQIYARAMIAVQSVRWLMLISKASPAPLNKTVYLYSREVEHSDLNINTLIEFFESELD